MKTILILGGRGMVGRNVVEHANAGAYRVVAPPRAELDLLDGAAVRRFIADLAPDIVVLIAGRVGGIEANRAAPVAFLTENLQLGMNVVLAAREAGVPRLLNLASSCMYPRDYAGELTENMILTAPLEPTNEGYAIAKIAITRLCQYIRTESPELRYNTLIPCNIYGRYDSFDGLRSHLVPAAIRKIHEAAVQGSGEVEIWGDGRARREFMYAEDLAGMVWAALDDFDRLPGEMNVGLGYDYSVTEYYQAVAEVVGWKGSFAYDVSRPSGMARKLVDVSRQTTFGWSPRFSLLEGIERTYRYYRDLADEQSPRRYASR